MTWGRGLPLGEMAQDEQHADRPDHDERAEHAGEQDERHGEQPDKTGTPSNNEAFMPPTSPVPPAPPAPPAPPLIAGQDVQGNDAQAGEEDEEENNR